MPLTQTQARDEMLSMLQTPINSISPSQDQPLVLHEDKNADVPKTPLPWCRAIVRHFSGGQASLSGTDGTKRYERQGTMFVQVFTISGNGLVLSDKITSTIRSGFEGSNSESPGGVWFRDVHVEEVGSDGSWFQSNVLIGFVYDEFR